MVLRLKNSFLSAANAQTAAFLAPYLVVCLFVGRLGVIHLHSKSAKDAPHNSSLSKSTKEAQRGAKLTEWHSSKYVNLGRTAGGKDVVLADKVNHAMAHISYA